VLVRVIPRAGSTKIAGFLGGRLLAHGTQPEQQLNITGATSAQVAALTSRRS